MISSRLMLSVSSGDSMCLLWISVWVWVIIVVVWLGELEWWEDIMCLVVVYSVLWCGLVGGDVFGCFVWVVG